MERRPMMERELSRAYDTIAQQFHDQRASGKQFYNEFLDMPNTLRTIGNVRGRKVLDIGCGPGLYANILHRRGAEVHGIDISEKEIEIAKQHYKGIDFRVASAPALPYANGYFDLVLIALAFTHFDDMDKALEEACRVLKTGGRLVISDGNPVIDATKGIKMKRKTRSSPVRYFKLKRNFGNYFDEKVKYVHWKKKDAYDVQIPVWHVTYETFFRMFREHGLALRNYTDSRPVPEGRDVSKREYNFTSTVPYLLVFDLVKLSPKGIREVYG
ncbi:MAG: class I SAM-dependent methyltransferase [Candidatus Marsarchaeota archaeon]|jgi:ubiquinone/menaquinone biosynthesis C-methylase UbiE|nr:class I SAM-dependent methyltransferase [Candidatus Marsarchaeota archaeon]